MLVTCEQVPLVERLPARPCGPAPQGPPSPPGNAECSLQPPWGHPGGTASPDRPRCTSHGRGATRVQGAPAGLLPRERGHGLVERPPPERPVDPGVLGVTPRAPVVAAAGPQTGEAGLGLGSGRAGGVPCMTVGASSSGALLLSRGSTSGWDPGRAESGQAGPFPKGVRARGLATGSEPGQPCLRAAGRVPNPSQVCRGCLRTESRVDPGRPPCHGLLGSSERSALPWDPHGASAHPLRPRALHHCDPSGPSTGSARAASLPRST